MNERALPPQNSGHHFEMHGHAELKLQNIISFNQYNFTELTSLFIQSLLYQLEKIKSNGRTIMFLVISDLVILRFQNFNEASVEFQKAFSSD